MKEAFECCAYMGEDKVHHRRDHFTANMTMYLCDKDSGKSTNIIYLKLPLSNLHLYAIFNSCIKLHWTSHEFLHLIGIPDNVFTS